jgi:glycosyltransferase involved in cell wall biosynthesis
VLDGEPGLLVPPDDATALTTALQRLLDDPALRHRLGTAGHDRAQRIFSAQRMAAEFHTEYARLAALPRETLGWTAIATKLTSYRGLLRPTRPQA